MKDKNLNIQLWTSVPGKYGDEQKFLGEISVKDISELWDVDVPDVEISDLTDEVTNLIVEHENNLEVK
tara:strand:- start:321 stop:524 length:204 start_codon:yes stop_codon:yes gene_type:complete